MTNINPDETPVEVADVELEAVTGGSREDGVGTYTLPPMCP